MAGLGLELTDPRNGAQHANTSPVVGRLSCSRLVIAKVRQLKTVVVLHQIGYSQGQTIEDSCCFASKGLCFYTQPKCMRLNYT